MADDPAGAETQVQPRAGCDRYDAAIAIAAAIATFVVHPVHLMLSHPFWLDEAWVADLTRASFPRLLRIGAPVPTGFVALLKLVPGSGLQRARLVVLGFSVLSVVMAYILTRSLGWTSRSTGRLAAVVAALVVMLAPLSLIRNDLKQYTCDASCALVVLAVGAWADRTPSRTRLIWFAGTAVIVLPFSWTSAFVTVAMFGGLLVSALLARSRHSTLEVLVVGGVTAIVVIAFFAALVMPKLNSRLHTYWLSDYLSGSPLHVLHVSWNRLVLRARHLAMPAPVFVALFALGLAALLKLKARAVAVAVVFLWIELFVAGRVHKYPFLELRTSQFLLVSSLVVVAIGAVALVRAGARVHPVAGAVVSLCLAAMFAAGSVKYLYRLPIAKEDVRSQTEYVAAHRRAHDVILVNQSGNFGFSYYWPHGHLRIHEDDSGQGFRADVAGLGARSVPDRTYPDILTALRDAMNSWQRAGTGSRLFIVRTHLHISERIAWRHALRVLRLHAREVAVGPEPLLVVGPR